MCGSGKIEAGPSLARTAHKRGWLRSLKTLVACAPCLALSAAAEPIVTREKAAVARKLASATSKLVVVEMGLAATLVLLPLLT